MSVGLLCVCDTTAGLMIKILSKHYALCIADNSRTIAEIDGIMVSPVIELRVLLCVPDTTPTI